MGNLALTNTIAYEREPSVAYNPASGEFIVVYSGTEKVNGVEIGLRGAQRVKDGARARGADPVGLGEGLVHLLG